MTKKIDRRSFLKCVAVSAAAMGLGGCGTADTAASTAASGSAASGSGTWAPAGNVDVIVAYKAGSGTDNTTRVLTTYAEKYVGQTLVVQNVEGASGALGWAQLAGSDPDGMTIGLVNLPTLCSNISEGLADYTMEDFLPICNHVTETAVVLVAGNSPYNKLEELVAAAKEKPGELQASTNGAKASNHIGAQLLAHSAGFEYNAVPYGGTADQLLALRQGEVDFSVAKPADFISFASEVKILGVFNNERLENYPDVPTLGELGYYDQWYGSARCLVAPKGTPQNVIDFYAEAFKATMEDTEYLAAAAAASMETDYRNPEQTAELLASQDKFCEETLPELFPEG